MKTISRYIMTLALLITAATGAWAQETPLVTIESKDYKSFKSGSMTFDDKVTVTFSSSVFNEGNSFGWYSMDLSLLTVAGTNGYTITSCKFYTQSGTANTGYTVEGESPTVYLYNGYVYTDANQSVNIGSFGVTKIEVYGAAASSEPAVEVTINEAKTEASFDMPAYDATADYELVRDMSIQMTAQVGTDPEAQPRYRVKKDGNNKFIPADMEMAAVPALFTVNDAIEQKALTQTDYIVQIYAIDAEGQPTGEAMTFATFTFEPGIYAVKAVAAQGSDYDGETALSNTFKLFQGYEVEVPAHEYVTYCSNEALTLEDENAALYTITAVSNSEATLSGALNVAPATTPLLVENNSDESRTILLIPTDIQADNVTPATEFKCVLTEETTLSKNDNFDYYAFNGLDFVYVVNEVHIPVGKCFIGIQTGNLSARTITIRRSATAIGATLVNSEEVNNEQWFDLNGRKVNKPTKKGIYIKNGKKVIIMK